VSWSRPSDDSDGLVVSIESRHNALTRPDRRGRKELLAANIDQVLVVVAPKPPPDPFLVDRYLGPHRPWERSPA
jgi:ribosome biogenesis GTPase